MKHVTAVPKLPPREADSHKGTYGRVLVVAGSLGMSGAAILTGSAALRGGAGLVTVACPTEIQHVVAMGNPCYTTHRFGTNNTRKELIEGLANYNAFAVGPGLGRHRQTKELCSLLLRCQNIPCVLDADGLNNLDPDLHELQPRRVPLVMTPHPGEFAKLLGTTIANVQANRETLAIEFANRHKVILLLKGHRTIVTDGERVYTNTTGNPGMATGGSGDVLTGIIAALLAQKLDPFDAACLGAFVHGRAGDIAAESVGQTALTATDLLANLAKSLQELEKSA